MTISWTHSPKAAEQPVEQVALAPDVWSVVTTAITRKSGARNAGVPPGQE